MLKRIDRAKVDKTIGELLKRVAQINADLELCYFVNEIRLFGSAMNSKAESFGDVDIAYDLGRRKRPPEYKDWHDWSHQRWKLAGRRNLDFIQALYYAEHEVLRLLKGRNQYLSIHNFDDVVGIGADSIRLFILPEGQIESEDGESGEKLHQTRMASAKERAEKKEGQATEKEPSGLAEPIGREQSHEQIKQQMITAVKSLAFDLIRAIDELSPSEVLEQSITVTQQRIAAYRKLNTPDRIPDILRGCRLMSSSDSRQRDSCSPRSGCATRRTERINRRSLISRLYTPCSKDSKCVFSAGHRSDMMSPTMRLSIAFSCGATLRSISINIRSRIHTNGILIS
jgi:hypothetical protein